MEASKASIRVLVTGVTGFIGSTCAYQLLERGYRVRGTVRDKKNAKKLKPLEKLPHQENFEIVEADLLKADGWEAATKDCIYVLHVASPFPVAIPKDENLLIRPAVDGTLNVLRACTKSKVKKVVLTSSEAAILSLGPTAKLNLTEDDWADLATVPPYNKSKTLAEKAAWDYYKKQDKDNRFELATINPSLVLGPAMISTDFTSGEFVRQLITGDAFALPKVNFGIVDVRDVATAHILAMESKVSDGNRYICNSDDHFWMEEMAAILREEFGK